MFRKKKTDEYLLLGWNTLLIIPALVLAALLHFMELILFEEHYALAVSEPVFMILTPVIPAILLYFIISLVYTVIRVVGHTGEQVM